MAAVHFPRVPLGPESLESVDAIIERLPALMQCTNRALET
jgi:hypothetical protein